MEISDFNNENLFKVINEIDNVHKQFSNDFINSIEIKKEFIYNLRKKSIRNICEETLDFNFYAYMNNYCDLLNDLSFNPLYESILSNELEVSSRIKEPASIFSKIMHYRKEKLEKGNVFINKCLNDLFGFRIKVPNFIHSEETVAFLENNIETSSIKVHNSCKGSYNATHLYFKNGNNKFFPWELQIWNPNDSEENIKSHQLHKQGYAKWPEIYKAYEKNYR